MNLKAIILSIFYSAIVFSFLWLFLVSIGIIGEATKAEPKPEKPKYWTPPNY
jgi:Na+-transporting methylmalonyl-CoA/oxaloacetate decarboxylase gamma subunit